jgi:hypothetical protein
MSKIENNTFNEAQYAAVKNSLSPNDYQQFISFKRSQADFEAFKETQRFEGRKSEAGQDYFSRKAALIVRRVKKQGLEAEFAPDEDVLAYLDIHKLQKAKHEADGTYQDKMKISVSDEDIKAFCSLEDEGQFYKDITLEKIAEKVAATKGTAPAETTPAETTEEEIPTEE